MEFPEFPALERKIPASGGKVPCSRTAENLLQITGHTASTRLRTLNLHRIRKKFLPNFLPAGNSKPILSEHTAPVSPYDLNFRYAARRPNIDIVN
jgi:hypothetical protein